MQGIIVGKISGAAAAASALTLAFMLSLPVAAAPKLSAMHRGVAPVIGCNELVGLKIASSSIGLRTRGGAVDKSEQIAANGTGAAAVGDYCLVSGEILSIDPTAPNIRFHVALPSTWNEKMLMMGGGGFDGTIWNVAGNLLNGPEDALTPLGRGYAVFASDGGHQSRSVNPGTDGSFAVNQGAYRNWMGDALKKTRDAALVVVHAAYGRSPRKAYFIGGATGGREAFTVAAQWPADWDGVVALYPAQNVTASILGMLSTAQAFAAPGAYLDAAKRGALHEAALEHFPL